MRPAPWDGRMRPRRPCGGVFCKPPTAWSRSLDAARPDVIIAFLDDHFENHFRSLMPTVGIGVADNHPGPATQWLEALRLTRQERFGGAPEIAERLLRSLVADGYDVARMGEIEYGNNLMVPWKLMAPRSAPAIIPALHQCVLPTGDAIPARVRV